jgi:hypothetical protein
VFVEAATERGKEDEGGEDKQPHDREAQDPGRSRGGAEHTPDEGDGGGGGDGDKGRYHTAFPGEDVDSTVEQAAGAGRGQEEARGDEQGSAEGHDESQQGEEVRARRVTAHARGGSESAGRLADETRQQHGAESVGRGHGHGEHAGGDVEEWASRPPRDGVEQLAQRVGESQRPGAESQDDDPRNRAGACHSFALFPRSFCSPAAQCEVYRNRIACFPETAIYYLYKMQPAGRGCMPLCLPGGQDMPAVRWSPLCLPVRVPGTERARSTCTSFDLQFSKYRHVSNTATPAHHRKLCDDVLLLLCRGTTV